MIHIIFPLVLYIGTNKHIFVSLIPFQFFIDFYYRQTHSHTVIPPNTLLTPSLLLATYPLEGDVLKNKRKL